LLSTTSMFNQEMFGCRSDLIDICGGLVVTPDMHRVHHSTIVGETNSNFGFNLPWWDRLLGTYRDQPTAGHDGVSIGIDQFREPRELWLDRMLLQPLRGPGGAYPITWRSAA
jgi:sterol desaturase/sphingolipid hydroxylase (fatty acid hydroxylase superfamily)